MSNMPQATPLFDEAILERPSRDQIRCTVAARFLRSRTTRQRTQSSNAFPGRRHKFLFDSLSVRCGRHSDPSILGSIGVIDEGDLDWATAALKSQGLLEGPAAAGMHRSRLTPKGWLRVEELKRAHVSSKFAFFARRFQNSDLDIVFDKCLGPAVAQTGYELRLVTQRAGLVDAIIEDEIRRCRFLIADLSDDNAGAYWEAGFAEGLGKPVIYVCRAKDGTEDKLTHFDANHRHTIRWDLSTLEKTAKELKAVIRNTLLGDATQEE